MNAARTRVGLACFSAAALVLGGAALSWACTPQAYITISPNSGAPGSSATVKGEHFANAPVQIRWGSASGPVIGDGDGPSFTEAVAIPNVEEGVYYVVAVVNDGGTTYTPSTTFEVISQSASGGEGGGEGGGGGGGGGNTSGSTSGGSGSASGGGSGSTSGSTSGGTGASGGSGGNTSSASGGGADSGGGSNNSGSASGGDAQSGGGGSTFGSTSGGRSAGGSATGTALRVAGSRGNGAVVLASGDVVFEGSLPAVNRTERDIVGSFGGGESSAPAGSRNSASAFELWSGLREGERGSLGGGIADALSDEPLFGFAETSDRRLAAGALLLALGLIGLFGGFLVAEVRRRRALSS
jgi:hypothetical protein